MVADCISSCFLLRLYLCLSNREMENKLLRGAGCGLLAPPQIPQQLPHGQSQLAAPHELGQS